MTRPISGARHWLAASGIRPEPRTIDLYSLPREHGRPTVWKRAMRVMPVNSFGTGAGWIRSGHYIIDYNGDAIAVHCANTDDGTISVQFMQTARTPCCLPRAIIESMLLGRVLACEELQSEVLEGERMSDLYADAF